MPREFGNEELDEPLLRRFVPQQLAPRAAERARRISVPRVPFAIDESLSVAVRMLEASAGLETGRSVELTFSVGGEQAYIALPTPLLQRLLARSEIRLPSEKLDSELVALLLEALFQPSFEALEALLGAEVALRYLSAPRDHGSLASLDLEIGTGDEGSTFPARVFASAPLLATLLRAWERRPRDDSAAPQPSLRLASRVAFIDLSLASLRQLGVGDAMLFDRVAVAGGAAIVIGESLFASAAFDESGTLHLSDPFTTAARLNFGDFAMTDEHDHAESGVAVADTDIEQLPVRLVFEIGRVDLTVDELRNLSVGSPLPLPRALTSAVDIYANGRRIGAGEMVMIGEQLGVRVTRLAGDA